MKNKHYATIVLLTISTLFVGAKDSGSQNTDYFLKNLSEYNMHNHAAVIIVKAHEKTEIQVKTGESLDSFKLRFEVLNAFTSPGEHPEIELIID